MKTFTVVVTLVYRVEAETRDEAIDVAATQTDRGEPLEGTEFLSGNYLTIEGEYQ